MEWIQLRDEKAREQTRVVNIAGGLAGVFLRNLLVTGDVQRSIANAWLGVAYGYVSGYVTDNLWATILISAGLDAVVNDVYRVTGNLNGAAVPVSPAAAPVPAEPTSDSGTPEGLGAATPPAAPPPAAAEFAAAAIRGRVVEMQKSWGKSDEQPFDRGSAGRR